MTVSTWDMYDTFESAKRIGMCVCVCIVQPSVYVCACIGGLQRSQIIIENMRAVCTEEIYPSLFYSINMALHVVRPHFLMVLHAVSISRSHFFMYMIIQGTPRASSALYKCTSNSL